MTKYSEQNVVKLKQEQSQIAESIVILSDKKKSLEREISVLKEKSGSVRSEIVFLTEQVAAKTNELKKIIDSMVQDISDLEDKTERVKTIHNAISRDEVVAEPVASPIPYVKDVLLKITSEVSSLFSKREEISEEVRVLKEQRSLLFSELLSMGDERSGLEDLLEKLKINLLFSSEETVNLRIEQKSLESSIGAIKARERDSRIMLRRVAEQYKAVYQQSPHVEI
jgi:chromosome segregation ATPase